MNCAAGRPGGKSSAPTIVAPGSPVTCKVTTKNIGFDAADFSTFTIAPKADLVDAKTVAGGPPAVLQGSLATSTTTIELRVSPSAHAGAKLSVAMAAVGSDETDRAPFFVSAVSNDLTVRRQR